MSSDRQQDTLLSALLESASFGIYTVDAQMHITGWNRKMAQTSGVGENEALGRNLFELFPLLEEEGFVEPLRRVLQRGEPEKVRLTHRTIDGALRFQKRRLAPLQDETGTTGVVVIVEDVTEFRRLLEQTIQSEKLVEIGRLSASIAHEINNPLTVIGYAAQLLLREEPISSFQRELLERIEEESNRLKTLTGSLLTFSRARESVRRHTVLNDVLRDVLRLLHFEFSRNSFSVEETYGRLPLVDADPNQLKQVFINLLMNAAQAMPQGGRIAVRTRLAGGEVEAVIADSGPGIPEAIRDRIFEPFFSSKKEGEGTGLGLYICRRIVDDHGGRLLLAEEPGWGGVFRVVLPACAMPEP